MQLNAQARVWEYTFFYYSPSSIVKDFTCEIFYQAGEQQCSHRSQWTWVVMDWAILGSFLWLAWKPHLHLSFLDLLKALSQCGLWAEPVRPAHPADVLHSAMCLLIKGKKGQQLLHFCTYWNLDTMERFRVFWLVCWLFFPCLLFLPFHRGQEFSSIQTSWPLSSE